MTEDVVLVRFKQLFAVVPELEYSYIAGVLNTEFRNFKLNLTRSAVSGMAKRNGLSRRGAYSGGRIAKPKPAPAPRQPKASATATLQARAERKRAQLEQAAEQAAETGALAGCDGDAFNGSKVAGLREFMQLESTCCRWPFDCDDGFVRYCPNNKPDAPSVPYCGHHTRAARGVARPYVRKF